MYSNYFPSVRSSNSLASLWEAEAANGSGTAVDAEGSLLEYEALELRLHPPNIYIDNSSYPDRTILIVDSANRPGTLVEVVQCLTELGLSVKQARISSDGGWFVDEFHVCEPTAGRVTDPRKLAVMKKVLSLPAAAAGDPGDVQVHTVFQIAGPEVPGMLADITQLLSHNGLEIRTAAVWTFNSRAAAVLGVTERNAAVSDSVKLNRLRQLLAKLVAKNGDAAVSVEQVCGPVHHERRLHQLLLADEVHAWRQLTRLQLQHSLPFPAPISTHHVGASDTGQDADQQPHTPRTPQQQWQRRMLPPQWTVDPKGKPVRRAEDVLSGQQQRATRQQQQQVDLDEAALVAATVGQSAQSGPAAAVADVQQQLAALQQAALLPPLAAMPGGVSSQAAAQEQRSVSQLIALLQPQPQSVSLPPVAFPKAAEHLQQSCDSSTSSSRDQGHGRPEVKLPGPEPAGPEPEPAAAAAASLLPPAAAGGDAGLPPRGPAFGLANLPRINVSSSAPEAASAAGGLSASLSAPCSPAASSASAALWSPAHLADAAAAAGILSPRAALTSPGADLGLHQQQQHPQGPGALWGPGSVTWEPEVQVQHSSYYNYYLVTIRCRDRNKLFFDTVCTLADLRMDIFHATIDGEATGFANQLFYVRPRFGDGRWDEHKAALLKAMLTSAVRRRFPPGQRVHVFSGSNVCLQGLVEGLRRHHITITRCKVRAFDTRRALWSSGGSEVQEWSHTFYLMSQDGTLPSRQQVQAACKAAGGELVDAPLDLSNPGVAAVLRSLDSRGRFAFSFVNARLSQQQRPAAATGAITAAWPAAAPAARGVLLCDETRTSG